MDKEERLYRREDQTVDRSVKSIHILIGNKTNVDILSKDKDHPLSNHPLRAQARKVMQSLRPTETTNATKLLLYGIAQSENVKQIKAAQFLFAHLDFMKMEPNTLRNALAQVVTDQTHINNIKAVIQTGEIVASNASDYNIKIAIRVAKKTILENLKHSPHYDELKSSLPKKNPLLPAKKTIFEISQLSEKDKRIIESHNLGVPHGEIAKNEGTSRRYIDNRVSSLRKKGASIERRTTAGSESEIQKRRELIRDYTLEGKSGRKIIKELKKQNIDVTPNQIRRDRSILRNLGELPPAQI